jgi:predicted SAM-dependent methyltransferase
MSTPHTWSPWRKANYGFFKTHLASLPKTSKLVDLGAGPLQFADLFLPFDYLGVDFEKFEHVSIVTDLTKTIPLSDQSADILTLSNVLEHIPNTEFFLRECKRLLKREGMIVGTVPFLLPEHQQPYDFNRYTHFQLIRLLENAGFEKISVVPLGKQIDVYDTIERKVFDQLYLSNKSILLKIVRTWRRAEMRLLRKMFAGAPATEKVTEGYGFVARG